MRRVYLPEFKRILGVVCFRDVRVRSTEDLLGSLRTESPSACIQLLDADKLAGMDHIQFAVMNAMKAFDSKTNASDTLEMEILLYASTQRQIRDAIQLVGVNDKTRNLAVVVIDGDIESINESATKIRSVVTGEVDDSVLDGWNPEQIGELFKIGEEEIQAMRRKGESLQDSVCKLVLERMAILSTHF